MSKKKSSSGTHPVYEPEFKLKLVKLYLEERHDRDAILEQFKVSYTFTFFPKI